MLLVYENRTDGIVAEWKKPVHLPPHLHEAIEVVYVRMGILSLESDKNCITWTREILQSCFQM